MSRRPNPHAHALDALCLDALERHGAGPLLARLRLAAMWPEVVGATLAERCWPESIENGKLLIAVPNPTWRTTLESMKGRICQTIQQRCPELGVKTVRIQLGQRAAPAAAKPAEPELPRPASAELDAIVLSAAARRAIEETAARIDDEELREQTVRAMVRQQQLRQWRLKHGWTIDGRTGDLVRPAMTAATEPKEPPPAANSPRPGPSRGRRS